MDASSAEYSTVPLPVRAELFGRLAIWPSKFGHDEEDPVKRSPDGITDVVGSPFFWYPRQYPSVSILCNNTLYCIATR